MIVVTPSDAFALALIARKPGLNADLVAGLSPAAMAIGRALTRGAFESKEAPQAEDIAVRLIAWVERERKGQNKD